MISSQPKFQIFVSSTFNDLEDERRQIIKATLEMGHIPVGMEMFSAADEEQWKVIQRQIDISDYYVVIVARRYGSRTPENISYTEKEYRYALETNIPIIGFVLDSNASWDDKRSDKVKKDIDALKKFKMLIQKKPVAFFTNPDDLSTKYSIALIKLINTNPRVGWVKADQATSSATLEQFAKISEENDKLREEISLFRRKEDIESIVVDLNEISIEFVKKESGEKQCVSVTEIISYFYQEFLSGISMPSLASRFHFAFNQHFILNSGLQEKLNSILSIAALHNILVVQNASSQTYGEFVLTEIGKKVVLLKQKAKKEPPTSKVGGS